MHETAAEPYPLAIELGVVFLGSPEWPVFHELVQDY